MHRSFQIESHDKADGKKKMMGRKEEAKNKRYCRKSSDL
jgi:hypothetical protein